MEIKKKYAEVVDWLIGQEYSISESLFVLKEAEREIKKIRKSLRTETDSTLLKEAFQQQSDSKQELIETLEKMIEQSTPEIYT